MSDKRFLSAVVLLVRSLKTINKPEMMEIGALTDLRACLVLQEGVRPLLRAIKPPLNSSCDHSGPSGNIDRRTSQPPVPQKLLLRRSMEGLHSRPNHSCALPLSLRPFHRTNLSHLTVPLIDFGEDVDNLAPPSLLDATFHTSGRSNARLPRLSKLQRYLNSLSLQPSSNPLLDEPIDDLGTGTGSVPAPTDSEADSYDSFGSFSVPTMDASDRAKGGSGENPEIDSFVYIESLLESLAVLGKLGVGLDTVGQRVAAEVFALVESTVEEVEDRSVPFHPL